MAKKDIEKNAIEEIRKAPAGGGEKLDDARFPCYGVKCVYSHGTGEMIVCISNEFSDEQISLCVRK